MLEPFTELGENVRQLLQFLITIKATTSLPYSDSNSTHSFCLLDRGACFQESRVHWTVESLTEIRAV